MNGHGLVVVGAVVLIGAAVVAHVAIGTEDSDKKGSHLVVYPAFVKQMNSPSFTVVYQNRGTTTVDLPKSLAEECLLLDGEEYKRQSLKFGGGSNLRAGDSWSHTISVHDFLPASTRLQDGKHSLIIRFGGQESEPIVFAWSN